MADASVVFNVIGKDAGVTDTLDKIKGTFKSTGAEGAAAMKVVDHEVEKLDGDIKDAKNSLQALAREFAKASTAAERLSISRSMKRQSTELRQLVSARDLLPKDEDTEQATNHTAKVVQKVFKSAAPAIGKDAGTDIMEQISQTFSKSGAAGATALIGIAVAAAPTIGSLIEAAILGGAGIGGVVGGVMVASKDSRVQSAWKSLATTGGDMLKSVAEPFVPVVLDAIRSIGGAIQVLRPIFATVFNSASGYLKPLVDGALGFAVQFAAGFSLAVKSAGPVIAVIANRLPAIGNAIGNLFATAAQHADGAAKAMGMLLDFATLAINVFAKGVDYLANIYDWVSKVGMALGGGELLKWLGLWDGVPAAITPATGATMGFKSATDQAAASAQKEASDITSLVSAMDGLRDANLSVFDATTKAKQAISDSSKEIKKNGDTLNANTAAGRANRDALSAQAKAANALIDANNKAGTSAGKATKDYNGQRAALIRSAEAAGMSTKAANKFADSVLHIPNSKTTNVKADTARAKAAIGNVGAALGRIPRTIIVRIIAKAVGVSAASAAIKLAGKLAGGGPMTAGLPYLVGEQGPELVVPDNPGTVITASKTRNMLAKGAPTAMTGGARMRNRYVSTRGHEGGARAITLELNGERSVVEFVRRLIRGANLIEGAI